MPGRLTLSVFLLSASALASMPLVAALQAPPAYADAGKRDKGEKREKGPSSRADKGDREARGSEKSGKGGKDGGGSGDGGGSDGGTGGDTGGSTGGDTGGDTGGGIGDGVDDVVDDVVDGIGDGVGGVIGGGDPDTDEDGTDGGSGSPEEVPTGGNSGGGVVAVPAPPQAAPERPFVSGSNRTERQIAIRPRLESPARLGPYADALANVANLRAALVAAEADLARLRGLPARALARQYPAIAPSHDVEAHARDLRRLEGAGAEWQRLSGLTEAERAQEFPSAVPGAEYDTAAFAAARRSALLRARDHDTLANLAPERLAQLYPAPRATGHDRAAHARAIRAAEAEVDRLRIAVARAEAAAEETLFILTGGNGLTSREAQWVNAYLGR